MTDKFKKRVREHAEKHGMSYQAAQQQLSKPDALRELLQERITTHPGDSEIYDALFSLYLKGRLKAEVVYNLLGLAPPEGALADLPRFGDDETEEVREVFEANAVLYNGETTTLRVSMIGGHWHPLGEGALDKFRTANRVTLPDGTVIKDREGVAEHKVSCPFHKDAQASVRVLPDGSFFCFACHAKGNTTDPSKPECFIKDPAVLYKLPPPDDDTATESAEEGFAAWVQYARNLETDFDIDGAHKANVRTEKLVEKLAQRGIVATWQEGFVYEDEEGGMGAPDHWQVTYPDDVPNPKSKDVSGRQGATLPKKIIVNGRSHETDAVKLTFGEIVALAFEKPSTNIEALTVTYRGPNQTGSMSMLGYVTVEDGMIFNVADTGNA